MPTLRFFAMPRLLAVACVLALAGCANLPFPGAGGEPAATPSGQASESAGGGLASLFDGLSMLVGGKSAELRALVEGGELARAQGFYAQHRKELDASSGARPWIARLAQQLNERDAPRFAQWLEQLREPAAELPPQDWPRLRQLLLDAQAGLDARDRDALLSQSAYELPQARALHARMGEQRAGLQAALPLQFARLLGAAPPLTPEQFFERYPLPLLQEQRLGLLQAQAGAVADAMAGAGTARSGEWIAQYQAQEALQDERTVERLRAGWLRSWAREKQLDPARLSRESRREAERALAARVPQWQPAPLRVALLPVLGANLPPERQPVVQQALTQIATLWNARLLPGATLEQAAATLAGLPAGEDVDLLALVEVGRVSAIEGPAGSVAQPAQFLLRYDNQPNPEYHNVQRALAQAERDWREAERQEQQAIAQSKAIASQSRSGLGALAVIGMTSTAAFGTVERKSRVEKLAATLGQTPASVQQPVYGRYQRTLKQRRLLASAPAAVHLYDPWARQLRSFDVRAVATQEIREYEGVHPGDPQAKELGRSVDIPGSVHAMGLQVLALLPGQMPALDALEASARTAGAAVDLRARSRQARERHGDWMEQQKQQLAQSGGH